MSTAEKPTREAAGIRGNSKPPLKVDVDTKEMTYD